MDLQEFRPATLQFERGVPGNGRTAARFMVKGTAGTPITLTWTAQKAKQVSATVKLGESLPVTAEATK
jgi:hypothetical protein